MSSYIWRRSSSDIVAKAYSRSVGRRRAERAGVKTYRAAAVTPSESEAAMMWKRNLLTRGRLPAFVPIALSSSASASFDVAELLGLIEDFCFGLRIRR
jgi:hypothetical protein